MQFLKAHVILFKESLISIDFAWFLIYLFIHLFFLKIDRLRGSKWFHVFLCWLTDHWFFLFVGIHICFTKTLIGNSADRLFEEDLMSSWVTWIIPLAILYLFIFFFFTFLYCLPFNLIHACQKPHGVQSTCHTISKSPNQHGSEYFNYFSWRSVCIYPISQSYPSPRLVASPYLSYHWS